MSDPDVAVDGRVAVAERAVHVGSEVALDRFGAVGDVERKADETDYVTPADRDAQRRILSVIRDAYPGDVLVAEEDDAREVVPGRGPAWVVDPIDGTFEFVRGLPLWAVSVAAVVDGEPVAAANALPVFGETYVAGTTGARRDGEPVAVSTTRVPETAAVGVVDWWDFDAEPTGLLAGLVSAVGEVRRLGSSQPTLTYVASGALDAAVSTNPYPWNNVAGVHLIRAAGGTVTDLDGDPWRHDSDGLVASNGRVHETLLDVAGSHRR